MLLIQGKEHKRKKSNEWVPVFGYASADAAGRDRRNGEMTNGSACRIRGAPHSKAPQAQTMSPPAASCPTLVEGTKN